MAIELTEEDKLWCKQNHIPIKQFQKVRELFNGDDTEHKFKELFIQGNNEGNGEAKQETKQEEQPRENISFEEWQIKLNEKYQNLINVSNEELPGLWPSLEFELSVRDILNIKDCTLPFAGILLGPPGAKKTLGLQLFRKIPNTFYTDNFSARSFVSHSTTVKKEQLPDIDMLPKIKDKFFLTPELAPIFGKKDEELMEILSIITRILDGHGFESDTGAHGHRGYPIDIMFTWVGAAVDIPYKVHKFLGARGAKLYFYRLPLITKSDEEYMDEMTEDDFDIRTKRTQDALIDYLDIFNRCPNGIKEKNLIKIQWNGGKDDKESLRVILKLAKLLAHFRAVVSTWGKDKDEDYEHAFATIEDPTRAMIQLRNLARGHALSQGRNYITTEDMKIIIETVFSTASLARVRIFELLLESEGKLTTSRIVESLNISDDTARRTMTELQAIGLVDIQEVQGSHGGEPQKQIELVNQFRWFLSKEFKILNDSHSARKNSVFDEQKNHNYSMSILLNSVLPRTGTHYTFMSGGKLEEYDSRNNEQEEIIPIQIQNSPKIECPSCGEIDYPYYIKRHNGCERQTPKEEREYIK